MEEKKSKTSTSVVKKNYKSKENVTAKSVKSKRKKEKTSKITFNKKNPIVPNTKVITDDFSDEIIEKRNSKIIIIGISLILALIFLVLLGNKTFFRNVYTNKKLKIELPVFMYFVSDNDNVVTFKTLRKSENVRQYFDEYLTNLKNFDYHNCPNSSSVYYNEKTGIAIEDISVTKGFALKTVKIKYDIRTKDNVCK